MACIHLSDWNCCYHSLCGSSSYICYRSDCLWPSYHKLHSSCNATSHHYTLPYFTI